MHRDRTPLLLVPLALALGAAMSCASSEPIDRPMTGAAGTTASGAAGTTASGAAGTMASGAAGTMAAAGTTGAAGTVAAAGTTGAAGTSGAAGTKGAAGTGSAGTTGAAGTGADAGTDAGGLISFATDIYPMLMVKCGPPCHTTATDGQLSMKDATTAYTNLVTNGAAKTNLNCKMLDTANKKRVIAGDPGHSFLYIKISQTDALLTPQGCQPAMPETKSTFVLTADQVLKIHDWIMGGAKP